MPVSLPLTNDEAEVVRNATKAKKIEVAFSGRNAQLTSDNFTAIRDALKAFHQKKRSVKTRTVQHLEICYNVQCVLDKMQQVAGSFGVPSDTFDASNDNATLVAVEAPEITKDEADGIDDASSE
jgi:hypothetical protein